MPRSPTHAERGQLANPIDMLGGANAESFEHALPPVLADPSFDAVIVLFVPTVGTDEEAVGAAISRAAATGGGKPVLCAFLSAKGAPAALQSVAHVPSFAYPEAAAKALGRAVERGEWLRRPAGRCPSSTAIATPLRPFCAKRSQRGDGWLDAGADAPPARGVRRSARRRARRRHDAGRAVEAAREIGFPVVLEDGRRRRAQDRARRRALDLADEDAVRAAAEQIGGPVLVQPFIRGGAELLAGAVQDPVFGPLVAFGPGGVLAELIGEAQFRLAPLTDVDAQELVRSGKAGRLVAGFRGAPPADEARSSTSCSASRFLRRSCRRSRSSISTRCSRSRIAASPSTRASA